MNTAGGKTYEYQETYRTGGIDFDIRPRSRKNGRKKAGLTAGDKKKLIILLLAAGLVCVGIIIAGAYAATVNYTNNQLRDSNAALQGEVESLQIEIQSANNLATIEKKATKEIGMVYPEGQQLVVLSGKTEPDKNFAADLKKSALN
ncbi:MAG: cell division protein FtsL [Eubacteriaceae bacterium]|nr:cell division protein FtsL [Eubacteriaceae bacterium]